MVAFRVAHLPLPGGAPAPKKQGRSHHLHPSHTARRCAGRGGIREAQPRSACFVADAGNPCGLASDAAFRGPTKPQRRGLRPLSEKR